MLFVQTNILVVLCLVAVTKATDNLCDNENGGCSDQCIDRGTGEVKCGCPCGMKLAEDGKNCETLIDCGLDIYLAVDNSLQVEATQCYGNSEDFDSFEVWQQAVIGTLKIFEELEATPDTNVGIQFYAGANPVGTTSEANYIGPPNVADAIAKYSAFTMPNCGSGSSFVRHLLFAGEISPLAEENGQTFVPNGPSSLRPRSNTTRVAMALVLRGDSATSDDSILVFRDDILLNFDQIIVITRTNEDVLQPDHPFGRNELITRQARLAACGSNEENCPYVFWVDRPNDIGLPFSSSSLTSVIDKNACAFRLPEASNELKVTSCINEMVFKIPLCALRGLNASDLQFPNSSCAVEDFAEYTDYDLVVTLEFGACGMNQEYIEEEGELQNLYTMLVTNKDGPNVYVVEASFSCTIAVLGNAISLAIKPGEQTAVGNITKHGTFPLDMYVYLSDQFSTPATPPVTVKVGCPIYLQGSSVFPVNLYLLLWSCWATPSPNPDDEMSHYLAQDGCAKDSTFEILQSPNNRVSRASFEMFQFIRGFKKMKDEKPPVYIHCKFMICETGDNSLRCNPDCSSRRRRSIGDDETSIIKTIGPFIVENDDEEDKRIVDEQLPRREEEEVIHEPSKIPHRIEIVIPQSSWTFSNIAQLVITVVLLCLIAYTLWTIKQRTPSERDNFYLPPVTPYRQIDTGVIVSDRIPFPKQDETIPWVEISESVMKKDAGEDSPPAYTT